MTTTGAVHDQERAKGVEDEPVPSPLVLLTFTTGLGPFEQMVVVTVAAKHFRRRQRRGVVRMTILSWSLSWV